MMLAQGRCCGPCSTWPSSGSPWRTIAPFANLVIVEAQNCELLVEEAETQMSVQPLRDVLELLPKERIFGLAASAHGCPPGPMEQDLGLVPTVGGQGTMHLSRNSHLLGAPSNSY